MRGTNLNHLEIMFTQQYSFPERAPRVALCQSIEDVIRSEHELYPQSPTNKRFKPSKTI
jgi:hypothetical protein